MSRHEHGWTAAWTTSPQRPGAGFAPNWSQEGLAGHTIRRTVRLGVGGDALRAARQSSEPGRRNRLRRDQLVVEPDAGELSLLCEPVVEGGRGDACVLGW